MPNLSRIGPKEKGLRGFVRDLGTELEDSMVTKFKERLEGRQLRVSYNDNKHGNYFVLGWVYEGRAYNFAGEFSIKQEDSENVALVIDRYPGVSIHEHLDGPNSRSFSRELKTAADIEDSVVEFLRTKFGDPVARRGNGCPIYQSELPAQYFIRPIVA
jgi:hypothetical protein